MFRTQEFHKLKIQLETFYNSYEIVNIYPLINNKIESLYKFEIKIKHSNDTISLLYTKMSGRSHYLVIIWKIIPKQNVVVINLDYLNMHYKMSQ